MKKVFVYFVFLIGFMIGAINILGWYGEYKERKITIAYCQIFEVYKGIMSFREANDVVALKVDWQKKLAPLINKEGCAGNINSTGRYIDALGNGYRLHFSEDDVVLVSDNAGGKLNLSLKDKFKFSVAIRKTED